MVHWHEEDEEVFVHARSPQVLADILDSSQEVRVELSGITVANTTRARFLFETGLLARHYIPRDDVIGELLPSDLQTRCPCKGAARYHHFRLGANVFENIVWQYPDPVHESARIKDYSCFFNEKVDKIFIDGEAEEKPVKKWS
jgi:uncharacterized protein (DUF427 family)